MRLFSAALSTAVAAGLLAGCAGNSTGSNSSSSWRRGAAWSLASIFKIQRPEPLSTDASWRAEGGIC